MKKDRSMIGKVADFAAFPVRALFLHTGDLLGLSSLQSERFSYVCRAVRGYCLDVGCGRYNRFVREYLENKGKGIDVYPHEGLTDDHVVPDISHFPFPDGSFDTVTFIANFNHVPESLRDIELQEAKRVMRAGGTIIITMGNPLAEVLVHKLIHLYDSLLGTRIDLDVARGMQEGEALYVTDSEILQRLDRAGFCDVRKKYFWTQWALNHMLIARKPGHDRNAHK